MATEALVPFLLTVLAMELTPGPNMAYLAVVSARSGRRAGLAAVAGVTLGLGAYLAASVAGIAQAAERWPWAYQMLRWAGVAYLLWLAFDAWRERPVEAQAPDDDALRRVFLRGLVANLLNPKAALLYVALLPGFITPGADPVGQSLWLGGLHLAISVLIHGAIVVFAGGAQRWLVRSGDWAGRVMALALVAVAVWLAISA
ncbi:MAG: LysE family translocator [Phenylobacterium sp.]|nr:LysE family translocator [Phenylobacterium sp.]